MARAVWLVEDDEAIRTPLKLFLEAEGFTVVVARQGKEALQMLRTMDPPGLILLDLMMPEMSGSEFLAMLKSRQDLRTIPVVIMTAWLHRAPEVTATADDVLLKPIDTNRLLELVSRYCGGSGPEAGGRRKTDIPPGGPVPPLPKKKPRSSDALRRDQQAISGARRGGALPASASLFRDSRGRSRAHRA